LHKFEDYLKLGPGSVWTRVQVYLLKTAAENQYFAAREAPIERRVPAKEFGLNK
jgi:hypothetical protein